MKNVIITGANSGLGFETAKKIARDHAFRVILACRNEAKAARAKADIISATGNGQIDTMKLDTSSLASVRAFANAFIERYGTVDVLINNAGISPMRESGVTEEGFEVVFATNYLGHFLLTQLLLPYFSANGRILNVTSDMHNPPFGELVWKGVDILAHPTEEVMRERYYYSKLCNLYFVYELARRLEAEGRGIRVNAFNPGMMQTNFAPVDKARAAMVKLTMPKRFGDLEKSSDAYAELVVNDALAVTSANYYDRSTTAIKSSELSYDMENAKELWEASERLCGLK